MNDCILSLDTATSCGTIALTRGNMVNGQLLALLQLNSSVTHSRHLVPSIDWLMADCQIGWEDVKAVAVGLGPGSFTGLRIGLATAKGLVAGAGIPLLGVSTLDILAHGCPYTSTLFCSVLDARKQEVYCAFYRYNQEGIACRQGVIRALAPEQLIEEINEPVMFVGDGVMQYGTLLQQGLGELMQAAPAHLHYPSAAVLGMLAEEKLGRGEVLDAASAVPLYVRASDAELSLIKKRK